MGWAIITIERFTSIEGAFSYHKRNEGWEVDFPEFSCLS